MIPGVLGGWKEWCLRKWDGLNETHTTQCVETNTNHCHHNPFPPFVVGLFCFMTSLFVKCLFLVWERERMNDEICFEESCWKSFVSFGIDESLMRIVMSVFELMISIVFVIID